MRTLIAFFMGLSLTACQPPPLPPDPLPPTIQLGADIETVRDLASLIDPEMRYIPVIYSPRAEIAFAILNEGRELVVLNRNVLMSYDARYGHGAALGIVAHEMGHLMAFPDRSQESADEWAGCILRAAELPIGPFLEVLREFDSPPSRIAAAWHGWRSCRRQGDAVVKMLPEPSQ